MPRAIIRRKLTIPPVLPGAIRRKRLLRVLDEAVAAGSHVALVAGPGYGKTSLLADWCRCRSGAWIGLDSEDADLDHFLEYLIAALGTVVPGLSTGAAAMGGRARDREGAMAAMSLLLADLDQQSDRPAVLVLDDYHLAASPSLDLLVVKLIKYLPGTIHLALASRRTPDVQLSAWQSRRQVRVIEEAELAFDSEEIAALGDLHPAAADTRSEERVWPAALGLPPDRLDTYVEEEMLRGQPPEIRNFLQRSAVLGTLDADWCESVLGDPLTAERREWLLDYRLAVVSEGGDLEIVRPLRDMLRRRFAAAVARPDRERILGGLAEYCWERGQGLSAIRAWTEAGQADRAALRLAEVADAWLARNRLEALANALAALDVASDRPDLLLAEGELHRRWGDTDRAAQRFDGAGEGFLAAGDARGFALTRLRKAQALASRGDVPGAEALLAEARAGIPADDCLQADVANLEGGLDLLRDQARLAAVHFEDSLCQARRFADPYAAARAAHNLGVCHTKLGDFRRALQSYETAMVPLVGQEFPPLWMSPINHALVLIYLDRAAEARSAAEEALARVRRFNLTREEGYALRTLGLAWAALGYRDAAVSCHESAEHLARRTNDVLGLAYSLNFQAEILAGTGESEAALRYSEEVLSLIGGSDALAGALEFAQSRARVLTQLGRRAEAAPLIAMLIDQARSKGYQALLREVLALQQEPPAITAGVPPPGRSAPGTVHEGPAPDSRPAGAGNVADGNSRNDPSDDSLGETPEIQVRCFGGLKVRASQGPVGGRDWQSGKAKQLLAFLLHHPEGATKARLLEMLYPGEVSTDSSLHMNPHRLRRAPTDSSLHMNLHRLRKALEPSLEKGQQSRFILWSEGFYSFNRQARVSVDSWSFEAALRPRAPIPPDPAAEVARLRQALDLYAGEFLPEFELDWVVTLRQRFRDKALAACSRLIALLDDIAAVEVAHRALEIDPLATEFHRELILRFLEAGERHRAIEHHRLCERRFLEVLGMPPPEDISALVRDLQ